MRVASFHSTRRRLKYGIQMVKACKELNRFPECLVRAIEFFKLGT
jgi:hypothetical protein